MIAWDVLHVLTLGHAYHILLEATIAIPIA